MRLGYNTKPNGSVLAEPGTHRRNLSDDSELAQLLMQVGLGPGDTLDDRFLLTEVIRQGGMGTVFKAEDLHNQNRVVAVKLPRLGMESNPASYARFEQEEKIGCKLDHPSLLKFMDLNGSKSRPYIVTEYLRGCTLSHLLHRISPLPEKDALKFASLVCEALQYLHEHGVVHRDMKPSNVMICSDGTLRIMDFGISQMSESRRMTFVGFTPAMGTPDYIAPEQIRGRRGDQRTDIYSLGAMLYEMLTGTPPFDGDDPFVIMNTRISGDPLPLRKRNPAVSPQAEEICLRALQRDPARRYPTAAAMKADLDAPEKVQMTGLCDSMKVSTRWKRFLLLARFLTFTCILPLLIQVILFFWLWHHHGKRR
jgi:serine/threonine protein kinase